MRRKREGKERMSRNVKGKGKELTNLELFEFFALVPASLPLLLHSLDGYEKLVGVLWTRTRTALHG